jgi:hypothetical protein
VCPRGIALLQRLGLIDPQGAVTARQKSAEGIVVWKHWSDSLGTSQPKGRSNRVSRDRRAKRRPERSPAISGVNGVASTNENS